MIKVLSITLLLSMATQAGATEPTQGQTSNSISSVEDWRSSFCLGVSSYIKYAYNDKRDGVAISEGVLFTTSLIQNANAYKELAEQERFSVLNMIDKVYEYIYKSDFASLEDAKSRFITICEGR